LQERQRRAPRTVKEDRKLKIMEEKKGNRKIRK
jgi:hypothetical protein